MVVVCSVENDQKGESLIVFVSFNCDLNQIRKGLKKQGFTKPLDTQRIVDWLKISLSCQLAKLIG